jgi:hypothetical protein
MELNDEINDFLNKKLRWEAQILKQGGPNYKAQLDNTLTYQIEGAGVEGSSGYRYFGAAKNLP